MKHRPATESDLSAVLDIWRASAATAEFSASMEAQFVQNFTTLNPPFGFYVTSTTAIVAWSALLPIFTNPFRCNSNAEFSLYVNDDAPTRCGHALGRFTIDEAVRSDLTDVWSFISVRRTMTHRLAESLGMTLLGSTDTRIIAHLTCQQ